MDGKQSVPSVAKPKYGKLFAAQFLSECQTWHVPEGAYDAERLKYIKKEDGEPAFPQDGLYATQGGNEITTHPSTTVSGVTFTDTDNG